MFEMRPEFITSHQTIEIPMRLGIATMQRELGAGFYSSDYGPLPFAVGSLPPERYDLIRLAPKLISSKTGALP